MAQATLPNVETSPLPFDAYREIERAELERESVASRRRRATRC